MALKAAGTTVGGRWVAVVVNTGLYRLLTKRTTTALEFRTNAENKNLEHTSSTSFRPGLSVVLLPLFHPPSSLW